MTWEEYFASSKECRNIKALTHIVSRCPNDDMRKMAQTLILLYREVLS